jgi:hypothetical protein
MIATRLWQVIIDSRVSGTHTVIVTHSGTSLSDPANGLGQQWVSITISGHVPQPAPTLALDPIPLLNGTDAVLS